MSNTDFKLKNDKFRKTRGGHSRLLEIKCSSCSNMLCVYQKDGPGILKRMYVDRIYSPIKTNKDNNFICPGCNKKNYKERLFIKLKDNFNNR